MRFQYQKIIQDYRNWVERDELAQRRDFNKPTKEIEDYLKGSMSEAEARLCALRLLYLGNWHSRYGVLGVVDGEEQAWMSLVRTAQYYYWNNRIIASSYDRAEN